MCVYIRVVTTAPHPSQDREVPKAGPGAVDSAASKLPGTGQVFHTYSTFLFTAQSHTQCGCTHRDPQTHICTHVSHTHKDTHELPRLPTRMPSSLPIPTSHPSQHNEPWLISSFLPSLLGVVLTRITYFGGAHSYVPWVPIALTAVLTYLLPEWHLPGQGQEPKWLCPGGYP